MDGQVDRHLGSLSLRALQLQLAVVSLNGLLDQSQTESGTRGREPFGIGRPEEFLKQFVLLGQEFPERYWEYGRKAVAGFEEFFPGLVERFLVAKDLIQMAKGGQSTNTQEGIIRNLRENTSQQLDRIPEFSMLRAMHGFFHYGVSGCLK